MKLIFSAQKKAPRKQPISQEKSESVVFFTVTSRENQPCVDPTNQLSDELAH